MNVELFRKWLYSYIHMNDSRMIDLLNDMFENIITWVENEPELEWFYTTNYSRIDFYITMYRNTIDLNRNNLSESMIEYISLQYSQDMVDLFLECKEKSMNYGSRLLQNNETADNFLQFIINNLYFINDDSDNEDTMLIDDEIYDSYDY
jgi:hypothetical protein